MRLRIVCHCVYYIPVYIYKILSSGNVYSIVFFFFLFFLIPFILLLLYTQAYLHIFTIYSQRSNKYVYHTSAFIQKEKMHTLASIHKNSFLNVYSIDIQSHK